jgi:rhodanese-related sulfurtransferase
MLMAGMFPDAEIVHLSAGPINQIGQRQRRKAMYLIAICVIGFGAAIFGLVRMIQLRRHKELERYSIDPDELHALLESKRDIVVLDVRQPLDLLAYSEVIPGAVRVPPHDVMEQAGLIPKDKDSVLYCICVSEKTSRMVLENALRQQFSRIKFLKGGLPAWKAKGYPVEPYTEPFHLDTAV